MAAHTTAQVSVEVYHKAESKSRKIDHTASYCVEEACGTGGGRRVLRGRKARDEKVKAKSTQGWGGEGHIDK